MMKIKVTFLFLFFSILIYGQSPEKFTYQSIIKNSSGYLLKNQEVGLRISILFNSSNGAEVYSEEHFPTSNSNGLVTVIIGEGLTGNNISDIDWGNGEYFIKVEVDPEGGINYTMNQTSQLLSVPYALYAENSGSKLNLLGQDFITLADQTLMVNKVDLTDDVDGVLPITNGGTGSDTAPMVGVITAADEAAARSVLGLGTAATTDSSAFATAAQGTKADTALQDATAFATAAQGALADTALQDATAFATAAQGTKADGALQAANDLSDLNDAATARTNLSLDNVENTALSTWVGSTNVTTLGTISTGTWNGTAIADAYISSSATWNAKQGALTFGIDDTNSLVVDQTGGASDDDFAKFTANGIEGRSISELKGDLSLDNVENTALSTWVGSTNVTTLGTISTGTWNGTAIGTTYTDAKVTSLIAGDGIDVNNSGVGDVTITGESSSDSNPGIVELATTAETTTGTDATRAVTPDGLKDGYQGSTNVTTLGTISTGTWNGTAIAVANGGTGATTAANARTNLGIYSFRYTLSGGSTTENINLSDLITAGSLPIGYVFTGDEIIHATLNNGTGAAIASAFPASVTLDPDLDVLRINSIGGNLPADDISIIIIP